MTLSVATALRRMREHYVTSAGVVFRTETDSTAQVQASNRSVLSVDIEASETRANVPYTLTEEITLGSDASGLTLASVVRVIEDAVNGRTWFDKEGVSINSHRRVRTSCSADTALVRSAKIEWRGECSWL